MKPIVVMPPFNNVKIIHEQVRGFLWWKRTIKKVYYLLDDTWYDLETDEKIPIREQLHSNYLLALHEKGLPLEEPK